MAKRYYYKTADGKAWWNLKTPDFKNDPTKVEITEEEFRAHEEELKALAEQNEQISD